MLAFGLIVIVAPPAFQVEVLFVAQALSYVFVCFVLRLQDPREEADVTYWSIARQLANKAGAWILAYWSLVAATGQAPMLLVAQFGNPLQLAALGSAMRYYGIALSVVVAVNVVVLPHLSRANTHEDTFQRIGESGRLLLLAGGIVAVGAALGYWIIPFIDSGKYPQAPTLFVLLCTGLFPGIIMAPVSSALLRLGRTSDMVIAMGAGLIVTTCVALLTRSVIGAAAAAPIGALAQLAWGLASLRRARKSGKFNAV
jgi:O-antigen/teichoic acid export membrane protein